MREKRVIISRIRMWASQKYVKKPLTVTNHGKDRNHGK